MALEIGLIDVAVAVGTPVVAGAGWLFTRLWNSRGHEIRTAAQVAANTSVALARHIELDGQTHQEILTKLGDIQGDLGTIKGFVQAQDDRSQ